MQLDIFEHSRDVMLRNDVLQALERFDAPRSRVCWQALALDYPCDDALPALSRLIEAMTVLNDQTEPPHALAMHPPSTRPPCCCTFMTGRVRRRQWRALNPGDVFPRRWPGWPRPG